MSGILPSMRDTSAAEESSPRVIDLADEDAEELLDALSSKTSRSILAALHEEPATLTEVADAVDTTRQNAQYHVEKLREADAIEVVDRCYSEKGIEMKVYAPADRPLVVVSGTGAETTRLRDAIERFVGGLGLLGLASLVVQYGFRTVALSGTDDAAPGDETFEDTEAVQVTPGREDAATTTVESLAATWPGLLFFVGGLTVLLVGFAYWYVARYR